jgi:LmbE family N-acetylglucosaminyl deacetylase
MGKSTASRRRFLTTSLLAAGPILTAGPLPGFQSAVQIKAGLRVACVGGHPDDPESGCAGTLALYQELGNTPTIIYLTRGERGIQGKSNGEAAQIRSVECESACKVLGAKARFAGQIDGSADFTRTRVDELQKILADERPDVVFTHWPVDTHMDHQVASMCTIRACLALKPRPELCFFEVNTGSQTLGFTPNHYVDITKTLEKKRASLFAHKSQNGEGIWKDHHEPIASWRGREAGCKAAEAFVRLNRDVALRLPRI